MQIFLGSYFQESRVLGFKERGQGSCFVGKETLEREEGKERKSFCRERERREEKGDREIKMFDYIGKSLWGKGSLVFGLGWQGRRQYMLGRDWEVLGEFGGQFSFGI